MQQNITQVSQVKNAQKISCEWAKGIYPTNSLPTISTKPDFHLAVVAFGTERKENYRSEALKTIFCLSEAS